MSALLWLYGVSFVIALAGAYLYLRREGEWIVWGDIISVVFGVVTPFLNTFVAYVVLFWLLAKPLYNLWNKPIFPKERE